VRIWQRRKTLHSHRAQVRDTVLVAQSIGDRPWPTQQWPGRVEVGPYLVLDWPGHEVDVHVENPWQAEVGGNAGDVLVAKRNHLPVHSLGASTHLTLDFSGGLFLGKRMPFIV